VGNFLGISDKGIRQWSAGPLWARQTFLFARRLPTDAAASAGEGSA